MSAPAVERANPPGIARPVLVICAVLIALGALAFFAGLAVDAPTTWRAFHVNYLFYATLAQGGIVLAAMFVLIGARWPGPIRRIAEGLGAWVPVTVVVYLIGFIGHATVYSWVEHPLAQKAAWLNVPRLFFTDLTILVVMAVLSVAFLYHSLRPALHGAAERVNGPTRALFERWTAGWRGEEAEREHSQRILKRLSPAICLLFAVGYTILGFDQIMSLEPKWFSNLFGGFFAWGGFLCAVGVTALMAVLWRDREELRGHITRTHLHDLGKMIFAFSIFWMYLFWSQYLVIWYGNLPEETGFIHQRLGSNFIVDKLSLGFNRMPLISTWNWGLLWKGFEQPYAWFSMTVWALCWIVPFWVLLGARPKKTPWILGPVAALLAVGFWLEQNLFVWPAFAPNNSWAWAGWIQFGVAAGFLGAFVLVYQLFTRVFPSLPVPSTGTTR